MSVSVSVLVIVPVVPSSSYSLYLDDLDLEERYPGVLDVLFDVLFEFLFELSITFVILFVFALVFALTDVSLDTISDCEKNTYNIHKMITPPTIILKCECFIIYYENILIHKNHKHIIY